MGMQFRDDADLARWLALSKRGQAMMRDVLLGNDGCKFMELMLDRLIVEAADRVVVQPQTTLALVEVDPKYPATVTVYGEKHLRAKIVERPILHNPRFPDLQNEAESLMEEVIAGGLPHAFREIYGCVRASETLRHETVRQLKRRTDETRMNMEVIGSLNRMVAK